MFRNTKAALVYGQSLVAKISQSKTLQESNRTWLDFVQNLSEAKLLLDMETQEAVDDPALNSHDVHAQIVRLQKWMRQQEVEFLQTKSQYEQNFAKGYQAFLSIRVPS